MPVLPGFPARDTQNHRLIAEFREPAYAFADALNVAADAVYAQKLVIIGLGREPRGHT